MNKKGLKSRTSQTVWNVEYMLGYVHVLFLLLYPDKYYLPPGGSNTNFITNHATELCVYCVVLVHRHIPWLPKRMIGLETIKGTVSQGNVFV